MPTQNAHAEDSVPTSHKTTVFAAGLLLAAALPQAASAETRWLLVGGRYNYNANPAVSTFQVPTGSLEQCTAAGQKLMNYKQEPNDIHGLVVDHVRFVCVEEK
jgi:hypothetical protein